LLFSKLLSLAIVGSSAIVKVPQILIIAGKSSAEGISLTSVVLGLLCYTVTVAYNFRNGYAFSTYGETSLITVQDAIIAILILFYGNGKKGDGNFIGAAVFPVIYSAFAYSLIFTDLLPMDALRVAQSATIPVLLLSRVPQIYANYKNSSTGNLSSVAVFLFAVGSLARVFTTLQEVDDIVILTGFISGTVLNLILAAQMIYYWGKKPKTA